MVFLLYILYSVYIVVRYICYLVLTYHVPLPSNRQHVSNDEFLEDKREDYHSCYVLYCVLLLCTVICTHMSSSYT